MVINERPLTDNEDGNHVEDVPLSGNHYVVKFNNAKGGQNTTLSDVQKKFDDKATSKYFAPVKASLKVLKKQPKPHKVMKKDYELNVVTYNMFEYLEDETVSEEFHSRTEEKVKSKENKIYLLNIFNFTQSHIKIQPELEKIGFVA